MPPECPPTIVGSWETEVDTHVDPTFGALLSFTVSRTMTVVDNRPRNGETITTGFGTWKRTGLRTFEFLFKRFHLNGDGEALYTFQVHEKIVLSKDSRSYAGEGVAELVFPDGTVFDIPGVYNTAGKRIAVP